MSDDLPTLAVTGSTGAVGGLVAQALADAGLAQRLLVRDAARAPRLDGATVAVAEYGDRAAARDALKGVRTLLMVSAAESADRLGEHCRFVDAAVEARVEHIVYTSFAGASADSVFTLGRDHWHTEEHIRESGMRFTFLRDNFYLDFVPFFTGEDGVIRGPAGDGRAAMVARADVARAAVAVLRDPGAHADRTYAITGGEAITLGEAAAVLSEVRGTPVSYHAETIPEAYASRRRWPAPAWQYDAWVSTYTAIAAGEVAAVSDDVRQLTGRAPLTLREVLEAPS
ncbi:MAG: SDR family oxidoreductase [Lapillicoccus sp.]